MLSYSEILKNRRSIRKYKEKEVSLETIQEILKEATLSPSASNIQPWHFIIIRDKELMKKISDESKQNILSDIEKDPNSRYKPFKERLSKPEYNVFYNAPSLVIICGENNYNWFHEDCALYTAYFMFAAAARELGTCWIGLGAHIRDQKIREGIGLPNNYEVAAPIILGYPEKIPEIVPRKEPQILKIL